MDEEKKQSSKKELASKLKTAEAAAREKALKTQNCVKGLHLCQAYPLATKFGQSSPERVTGKATALIFSRLSLLYSSLCLLLLLF
jgi:hypothetical protein